MSLNTTEQSAPQDAPGLGSRRDSQLDDRLQIASALPISQTKEAAKDIAFGSFAGMVGKCIEYPFDTVKVRLQSQTAASAIQYAGPLDCFRKSIHRDGFWSLYRGISTPLFGAAAENGTVFLSYRLSQQALRSTLYTEPGPLPMTALLIAGAAAGTVTSFVLTPIELIKCKMQVPGVPSSAASPAMGPFKLFSTILRQHGPLGLWHGQLGTLIREAGGSAAWFGAYEAVGLAFRRRARPDPVPAAAPVSVPVHQSLLAGAAAGVTYNLAFYPADTVKSRMQTEDVHLRKRGVRADGFVTVARQMVREAGLKGLYRGCGITVARSAPSSAFIFTIYEGLKNHFGEV